MRQGKISRKLGAAALGMAIFALPALCGLARADGQAPAASNAASPARAGQNNATAQDNATRDRLGEKKVTLTLRLYDGVFSGPMPYWVSKAGQLNDLNGYRNQKGNVFVLEFVPKAQTFTSWTRLYGVYGFYLPGVGLDKFVDVSRQILLKGCAQGAEVKALDSGSDARVLEFTCSGLNPAVPINKGVSVEHGYMYIAHAGDSYVKVYQSWRGASANATESPDWATNPDIRKQVLDGIRTMRFTPGK